MANKLRVFISSTMKNLPNERYEVVRQLTALGFEPVNAEDFAPLGENSWDTIKPKIEDSHIFVLILGESYGWVPDKGYGADSGKSITHLEFELACRMEMPILTFMKHLDYNVKVDQARDAFRNEVSNWENGYFRSEFSLAHDLAEKVVHSIIQLGTQSILKERVHTRDAAINRNVSNLTDSKEVVHNQILSCNDALDEEDKWVLIAGAGLSIQAGYPTANFIVAGLINRLWTGISPVDFYSRYSFSEIASYYEHTLGRDELLSAIDDLLDTPQKVQPTSAHYDAVNKFKIIITTNYDELFEMACLESRIPFIVSTPGNPQSRQKGKVFIVKMSGTISDLAGIRLTSEDLNEVIANESYYNSIDKIISGKKVAVVGHSLRDDHIVKLLEKNNTPGFGCYVRPNISNIDDVVIKKFNLDALQKSADDFLSEFNSES